MPPSYFLDCDALIQDVVIDPTFAHRFHVKVRLKYSDPFVWSYFLTICSKLPNCHIRLLATAEAKSERHTIYEKNCYVTYPEMIPFTYTHYCWHATELRRQLPRIIFVFSEKLDKLFFPYP